MVGSNSKLEPQKLTSCTNLYIYIGENHLTFKGKGNLQQRKSPCSDKWSVTWLAEQGIQDKEQTNSFAVSIILCIQLSHFYEPSPYFSPKDITLAKSSSKIRLDNIKILSA